MQKKWQPARFACSLGVERLKTGVLQLKDVSEKAQNIWIESCITFFGSLKKMFLKSTYNLLVNGGFVVVVQSIFT